MTMWSRAIFTILIGNTGSTGTFVNSFAYTGAVIDEETGLYYMNARYYEPETGRFISQDTYRGEGEVFWNLYMYCDGDPVNCTDPTGHRRSKLVGFGVQIELSCVLAVGVELVWYIDKQVKMSGSRWIPFVYTYGGKGLDTSVKGIIKRFLSNPRKISSPKSFLISGSISIFAIFGYSNFKIPKDYAGKFKSASVTAFHVKGYYAYCNTCFSVGVGYSTSAFGAFAGVTNYRLRGQPFRSNSSTAKYIKRKAKRIKKR